MTNQKVKEKSTVGFGENQRRAAAKMNSKGLNAIVIPEGYGFYLVRAGTPEAQQREEDKLKVFSTTIAGEDYLVCNA